MVYIFFVVKVGLFLHTWFQWPLCTEYQIFPDSTGIPSIYRYSIKGTTGLSAWWVVSLITYFPGMPLSGGGYLYLLPPYLVMLDMGSIGTDGMVHGSIDLPSDSSLPSLQIWSQGALILSSGAPQGVGNVPEPAWIF